MRRKKAARDPFCETSLPQQTKGNPFLHLLLRNQSKSSQKKRHETIACKLAFPEIPTSQFHFYLNFELNALFGSSALTTFPKLKITTYHGLPLIWISEKEIIALAAPFEFTLIGKFSNRRPLLDSIRRFFFNLKLNGDFSVTILNPKYVLIKLVNDLDYSRVFFSPLISFPNLRPYLFSPHILHVLGSLFGRLLKIDNDTSIGSRPSAGKTHPHACSSSLGSTFKILFDLVHPITRMRCFIILGLGLGSCMRGTDLDRRIRNQRFRSYRMASRIRPVVPSAVGSSHLTRSEPSTRDSGGSDGSRALPTWLSEIPTATIIAVVITQ
ncbi:hypothetical protein IEQ34_002628 [Dendrobium chrysotoxum]|uniref:Maturase K n=1 Tax=Dendrobium chrysotoxum TaxID=161865 RepID=A0AAV7H0J0_DENCH|nr:hypothetical protein IEQ34_002628 [Dendrobium chrysotoxum]